jgi:hypothetical protein
VVVALVAVAVVVAAVAVAFTACRQTSHIEWALVRIACTASSPNR